MLNCMATCRGTDKKPCDNKLKVDDINVTNKSASALAEEIYGGSTMEMIDTINSTTAALHEAITAPSKKFKALADFKYNVVTGESLPL